MSRRSSAWGVASLVLLQMACCPTPVTLVATGTKGAYARVVEASGGRPAEARAGLIEVPETWPPVKVLHEGCTPGVNEIRELEASLGSALVPATCPEVQVTPVPEVGTPEDAESRPLGFMPYCYEMGSLVLVVEAQENLSDRCKHVVGLALFRKGS